LYREEVKKPTRNTAYYADVLGAMGAEQRLEIMRLLLSTHPEGMVVGDILAELKISASTLSHHLDKLKLADLVTVRRDTRYLWYAANTDTLQEILAFLFSECCSRTKAVEASCILKQCN
jgi:DNA-binding transcriptional ArsR family regulator